MNPTDYRRQVKRGTEDGPGRNRVGRLMLCHECLNFVFFNQQDAEWVCKCGHRVRKDHTRQGGKRNG
jgi:hypothetical protein